MSGLSQMALQAMLLALLLLPPSVSAHGRLFDPPGRSTMWRWGFNVPRNYDDNQLFCGGFARQVQNGGRCGVCGDPWNGPRENEAGGKYATGLIGRSYTIGQLMEVTVQLTANHRGYFQFRLCPNNDASRPVTQECLDRHLLPLADGSTRYDVSTARTGDYVMRVKLPSDVTCDQCVLQWRYHTGNSWGCQRDSQGKQRCCVGCGPQEEFYGCADIAIKGGNSGGAGAGGSSGSAISSGGNAGGSSTGGGLPGSGPDNQGPQPLPGGRCRATPTYSRVPLADQWCEMNCSYGYCPLTHCSTACLALKPPL